MSAEGKVKLLEWDKYDEARCLGLAWNFYETMPGLYNVNRCAPDHERLGTSVTKDKAMRLAQEDFDELVLSCILVKETEANA